MKKSIFTLLLAILTMALVACGGNNSENNSSENAEAASNNTEETVTIEHELGETEVDKNPEKVVVFDFGALDTMDKLGIEVTGIAQNNLPGYLEKYEDDKYENIGGLKEPDFEKIAEIDPDLIVISGRQSDVYEQLSELGPTIFLGVDTSRYMDSFEENTRVVGEIFEKEDEVEDILATIEDDVKAVKEKAEAADENSLIVLANDDKISAYGEGSRFGIIHDVFCVPAVDDNIEASTHGMNVTFEYVVEQNPDKLYVIDRSAAIGEGSAAKNIVENKLMEDSKAMQNDEIYYLNPDVWYLSGGGLISVEMMLDEISESLN